MSDDKRGSNDPLRKCSNEQCAARMSVKETGRRSNDRKYQDELPSSSFFYLLLMCAWYSGWMKNIILKIIIAGGILACVGVLIHIYNSGGGSDITVSDTASISD